jgi:fatty-acyl-CoA synthase
VTPSSKNLIPAAMGGLILGKNPGTTKERTSMLGLMQQRPLLISSLLDYAERYHAGTEIVSRSVEGPIHRGNWGTIASRARQVANVLRRLGVSRGERIATLAWNHNRHLEIYFGVTCSGAVLHTVNPRLFAEQVRFIIDDAEASHVFFDVTFAALVEQLAPPVAERAWLCRAVRA